MQLYFLHIAYARGMKHHHMHDSSVMFDWLTHSTHFERIQWVGINYTIALIIHTLLSEGYKQESMDCEQLVMFVLLHVFHFLIESLFS